MERLSSGPICLLCTISMWDVFSSETTREGQVL
jgi:hypothetical protein